MTSAAVALVLANLAYWIAGIGALLALGFVDAGTSTWSRIPAAYLFGVVIVVVPSSYLALLGVAVGWTAISVAIVVLFAIGLVRLRRAEPGSPPRRRARRVSDLFAGALAVLLIGLAGFVLVRAWQTFIVTPLYVSDAWVVWAARARLLYELPADAPGILRGTNYGPPSYPLAMPELEALTFRAIGRFDGTLIDLQLLALVFGLLGAMWSLSRGRARTWLVALVALAMLTAPQFVVQLGTSFVDIPLAVFVGSALLAGARWLSRADEDRWSLTCFVAFAGMAGLLKNEGTMFALAAVVSLLICARWTSGRSIRDAVVSAAGVAVMVVPWRLYGAAYRLPTADYDLKDVFNPIYLADHAERVGPVLSELLSELSDPSRWGLLLPVVVLGLVAGVLSSRWTTGLFAVLWIVLAFVGLVMTYWVSVLPLTNDLFNSSYRTTASLVLGTACLVPMLVDDAITLTANRVTRGVSGVSARLRPSR